MANTATLAVAISARGAVQGARQYQAAVQQMTGATMGASGAMGAMRGMALKLFAAVGGYMVIRQMTTTIMDFQDTMAQLQGVTQATTEQMERFQTVARELGATTRFTASQAAEGLLNLSRAGFAADESVAAISATLDLATGAVIDLGEASTFVANSIRQFNLGADEAGRVADVLTSTANKSNTTVRELADGMSYAGVVASQVGMSIEQTAAAMGVMADAGLRGSRSGMGLRQVLADLLAPSDKAVEVMARLGVAYDQVNPQKVGLVQALTVLRNAGMDTSQAFEIFGARAATAALAMTQNIEKINDLTAANQAAEGVAARNADLIENTLRGAYLELISTLQEVMLMIGDAGFTGALKDAIKFTTQTIRVLAGIKTESAAVSDNVLKVVAAIQTFWGWMVKLKNVFIAIVAIHLSVKLVAFANAMIVFGKATIFASVGLMKMAMGIMGTLIPIIGALGVAILAVEFGRWLESLEPVQKGMQDLIWGIVKSWHWLKRQVSDIFIVLSDFAVNTVINPLIRNFGTMFTSIMDMIHDLAVNMKNTARVLGMDDTYEQLRKVVHFTHANRTALTEIEIAPLGERMAENEREYEEALQRAVDAHSRAIDKITKKQAGKEDQSFVEFFQADITKAVNAMGIFKDKTADAKTEIDAMRASLEQTGQLTVEAKDKVSSIASMWETVKSKVVEYGQAAVQWLGLAGQNLDDKGKKTDKLRIKWEDMQGTIAGGLVDMTMGAKGFNDTIQDVTQSLIKMALQAAFMRALSGGAAGGDKLPGLAAGGIVTSPTAAIIGEKGPEAVIPLGRDERGNLGLSGAGGGGSNITFNIISPDKRGVEDSLLRNPKLIQQMNQTYKQGYAIG